MSLQSIISILDKLLSKEGCPWDQKQTLDSISGFILEEAYELVDAVDEKNFPGIMEEAGDLLFTLMFLIKLLEKESDFTLDCIIENVVKKMVGRHPHVFQNQKNISIQEIEANWKRIKKEEKKDPRAIPNSFPLLMRAKKIFKQNPDKTLEAMTEEKWIQEMLLLLQKGAFSNLDMERILRKALTCEEKRRDFRDKI